MKQLLTVLLLSANLVTYAQGSADPVKYAATITAEDLRKQLTIIAGPEMEGRETATKGQQKAAAYIAKEFKRIGLQPVDGKNYEVNFPLFQDELISTSFSVNGKNYEWNKDYIANIQSLPPRDLKPKDVVFAGYGIVDSVNNDYANLNVSGKLVVIVDGVPASMVGASLRPPSPYSFNGKLEAAKSKGAAGLIIISKDFPRRRPAPQISNLSLKQKPLGVFPIYTISTEIASALLGRMDVLAIDKFATEVPKTAYSSEIKIGINKKTNELKSSNVLGMLPGTDKANEYVFITSHYDHLGTHDGQIFYGADDDGSGTVSVIEIAEAFAEAKKKGDGPRRNIVFMTVSGEEKGLLGSQYYSEHPLLPLNKTSVDLNIDMVGRIDPDYKGDSMNYVYVIGDDKLSSDLRPITDEVNSKYANMELDRKYTDPNDPNRFYYRSDHYNFAAKGVPVIFYFNGTHRDYHRPTDTVDKINFDLMEKRVRLVYHTAWVIANRDQMLTRDIPLNIPGR